MPWTNGTALNLGLEPEISELLVAMEKKMFGNSIKIYKTNEKNIKKFCKSVGVAVLGG